jgi:hypothetical protein
LEVATIAGEEVVLVYKKQFSLELDGVKKVVQDILECYYKLAIQRNLMVIQVMQEASKCTILKMHLENYWNIFLPHMIHYVEPEIAEFSISK